MRALCFQGAMCLWPNVSTDAVILRRAFVRRIPVTTVSRPWGDQTTVLDSRRGRLRRMRCVHPAAARCPSAGLQFARLGFGAAACGSEIDQACRRLASILRTWKGVSALEGRRRALLPKAKVKLCSPRVIANAGDPAAAAVTVSLVFDGNPALRFGDGPIGALCRPLPELLRGGRRDRMHVVRLINAVWRARRLKFRRGVPEEDCAAAEVVATPGARPERVMAK